MFDPDVLRDCAGPAAFSRGEAYFREGRVTILSLDAARVVTRVAGTEPYRAEVLAKGATISGRCSCPAFEDYGFCKHMVASALAANAAGARSSETPDRPMDRIRAYLRGKPVEDLIGLIMGVAELHEAFFQELDFAASLESGDAKAIGKELRAQIRRATQTAYFVGYREVGGWAAGVEEALERLDTVAASGHAALALDLAEEAIECLNEALESIDDSDGEVGAQLHRAREIHLAAARAARPDPTTFAEDLFEREMEDDYDVFSGAAWLYEDVLGPEGLAVYRRLATEAWDKLPPLKPEKGTRFVGEASYYTLGHILDQFAERDGDVEARIAIRRKDLSSSSRYLNLAGFCLDQGRKDEALAWAREGVWVFEDHQTDERLISFYAARLAEAGETAEAERLLWAAFERGPNLSLYDRLNTVLGPSVKARAIDYVGGQVRAKDGRNRALADLHVEILMREEMFDAAWAAVHAHGASDWRQSDLAKATSASHPREALTVFAKDVEQMVSSGSRYEDAVKLIGKMAALRDAGAHAAYVADLKMRHHRKRNLMKLLG
jgi:uncharacterized Zn finger protein